MCIIAKLKISYLLIACFVASLPLIAFSQTIFFDDSDPNVMVVGNGTVYEIGIHKNTGAILYIEDIRTGTQLTIGLEWDPLWNVRFDDSTELVSSEYNPQNLNKFYYAWDAVNNTLTLDYIPDSGANPKITATVTLEITNDNFFNLQLHLKNEGGKPIREIGFHDRLGLALGNGDCALTPFGYPGIMLGSDFFASNEHMLYYYPAVDGDFIGLRIKNSQMSVYALRDAGDIIPRSLGLQAKLDTASPDNYLLIRKYITWVEHDSSWTSPTTRFRIGPTFNEALAAYRMENGIDKFLTLPAKLGDKFDMFSKSPLYYYAFAPWEPPGFLFSEFSSILKPYPSPSIIMLSMYYMYGFPGYSPDYIPPVPFLGSTEDFQNMVDSLQAQGRLVMPFTHSIYWHDHSATIQNLPAGVQLQDICVITEDGSVDTMLHWNGQFILFDKYYCVSPCSPFVQQRLAQVYSDIFQVYGCDMMYRDCIGGTAAPYDFNVNASNPTQDFQRWKEHLQQFKNYPVVTEGGYDRLTESITGIMGTNYDNFFGSDKGWNYDTDDGYWRPYPVAPFLYGDKVTFYNSWGTNATDKDIIAWNLFFNCPFTMPLGDVFPWTIHEETDIWPWCWVIHDFQYHVVSRTMGQLMDEYNDLDGAATRAVYGNITAIRNWDKENTYDVDELTIAPNGVVVFSDGGDWVAGILNKFNGQALSPGDHYLVYRTFEDSIIVHHPMGDNSPIRVNRPDGWIYSQGILVHAKGLEGSREISPTIDENYIQFNMDSTLSHYAITYDTTVVTNVEYLVPIEFKLHQNYPNPFNTRTTIQYHVHRSDLIELKIYNISGQEIRTLKNEFQETGKYSITWDGKNEAGITVPTGLYMIRLKVGEKIGQKKILIVK
ncbi:T9SS type A sorting domain-containing protein [candidate division KSB1 bacterium]|nr:T9SS type A sorting domain-containing protein [candidate division KSB1 bacterium]